jgi:hypothetical protein
MKLFRTLVLVTASIMPFFARANTSYVSEPGQKQNSEGQWEEMVVMLINNRMPESYYEILRKSGVETLDQLLNVNETTKQRLMKRYRMDRKIMLAGTGTRSAF